MLLVAASEQRRLRVDANLLIYAHVRDFAEHAAAREWLDDQINSQSRVGFAWSSLLAFMRITSNPRIFERPLSIEKAWAQVQSWLSAPAIWTPTPGNKHSDVFASLITDITRPNLVPDAHLAGDFARFERLRWENPL